MHTPFRRFCAGMGVRVSDALGGCQVASSYGSAAVRRAALCSAVAGLLLSACADTYHSPAEAGDPQRKGVSRQQRAQVRRQPGGRSRPAAGQRAAARPSRRPPTRSSTRAASRAWGRCCWTTSCRLSARRRGSRTRSTRRCARPNTKAQDIICIGRRIDGTWKHLAGARVQPYACKIGAEVARDHRRAAHQRHQRRALFHRQRYRRPERPDDQRDQPALDLDHHQAARVVPGVRGLYSPADMPPSTASAAPVT